MQNSADLMRMKVYVPSGSGLFINPSSSAVERRALNRESLGLNLLCCCSEA